MNSSPFKSLVLRVLLALSVLIALPTHAQQSTMVRLHSTQGPIDFKLLDSEAPLTVANFLAYVRAGDYSDVFFHRSVSNFIIQAGAYRWPDGPACCTSVTTRGTVQNEFSLSRSNIRGTVAMAKLGGQPNSATSQWFINMNNNASNLDNQNGGFTVFARVTAPGMVVADKIAALQIVNAGGSFAELPVANLVGNTIVRDNVVRFTEVTELPANPSTSDRIFNYLEAAYPQYLSPSKGINGVNLGYVFRYYAGSNSFLGTKDGKVWYLAPAISADVIELGTMANFLDVAQTNGY